MRRSTMRDLMIAAGTAVALLGCGAGDAVVTGIGNGGNHFYADSVIKKLALELARQDFVPEVTDEMLGASFDAIVENAREGDPDAALLLFRVAEAQRTPEPE